MITRLIDRVDLGAEGVLIRTTGSRVARGLRLETPSDSESLPIELHCPATRGWYGRQLRLVIPGPAGADQFRHRDSKLLNLIHEAHSARQLALAHPDKTIFALARMSGRCRNRLTKFLAISTLAPDIVTTILQGRQPMGFSAARLLETDLPLDWAEQRRALGFA